MRPIHSRGPKVWCLGLALMGLACLALVSGSFGQATNSGLRLAKGLIARGHSPPYAGEMAGAWTEAAEHKKLAQ